MLSSLALTALLTLTLTPSDPPLSRSTHELPRSGLRITELRFLDPRTGRIQREFRDQHGTPVTNFPELRAHERDLEFAARAGVSPELDERIRATPPGDILEVMFWLKAPQPDLRSQIEAFERQGHSGEEARRRVHDQAVAIFRPGNQAFAQELRAASIQVTEVAGPWPIVFAKLPAGTVRAWARHASVDHAYYAYPTWHHENENAQPTLRSVTAHRRGITGAKSQVKVLVQDTANVVTSCPYLPQINTLVSGGAGSHATAVAGNIAMQNHPQHYGVARALPILYSAGGTGDTRAPAAWSAGITAGISFGNCSWWNGNKGRIVGLDRFFDYTIRQYAVMMFKSNGNQGNSSTPYSTSPGNGYNMTCSGCYNDGDSADWADDRMASYSSYLDPQEGHQKPEVASPGDGVISTYRTSSPWTGSFGGTSSASPLTCGTATLMATVDIAIASKPEVVKALLMATAWHDVEGTALISDKDGAGGVHTAAACQAVQDKQWELHDLTSSSFQNGVFERPLNCVAGDETRVIGLWFSVANSARTTDQLMMDLDLVVLDPQKNVVTSSAHAKNPYELVRFTPAATGVYTLRFQNQRFQHTNERLAIAWSQKSDTATNEVTFSGSGGIGTTQGIEFFSPYRANSLYLALASATTGSTPLPGGYALPMQWDSLTTLSMGFFGFLGTLDGQGKAGSQLPIPGDARLRGLRLDFVMLTLDVSSSELVEDISPRAGFVVQ